MTRHHAMGMMSSICVPFLHDQRKMRGHEQFWAHRLAFPWSSQGHWPASVRSCGTPFIVLFVF
eukprot:9328504-Heterocapsa_arctica.AAC.1